MVVNINTTFLDDLAAATAALDAANPLACDRIACHCLQVTESTVREVVADMHVPTLCQLAARTGAGSGCTACHRKLRRLMQEHSRPSF